MKTAEINEILDALEARDSKLLAIENILKGIERDLDEALTITNRK